MITPEERQQLLDEEHLRLLAIGYFVTGGAYSALALFPMIYIVMGLFLALGMPDVSRNSLGPAPVFMGWLLVIVGFALVIALSAVGSLQLYVGRCLLRRTSPTLCMVAAGISCLFIPFGTLLGIFTFVVLGRPSVQVRFRASSLAPPPPRPPSPSQSTGGTT